MKKFVVISYLSFGLLACGSVKKDLSKVFQGSPLKCDAPLDKRVFTENLSASDTSKIIQLGKDSIAIIRRSEIIVKNSATLKTTDTYKASEKEEFVSGAAIHNVLLVGGSQCSLTTFFIDDDGIINKKQNSNWCKDKYTWDIAFEPKTGKIASINQDGKVLIHTLNSDGTLSLKNKIFIANIGSGAYKNGWNVAVEWLDSDHLLIPGEEMNPSRIIYSYQLSTGQSTPILSSEKGSIPSEINFSSKNGVLFLSGYNYFESYRRLDSGRFSLIESKSNGNNEVIHFDENNSTLFIGNSDLSKNRDFYNGLELLNLDLSTLITTKIESIQNFYNGDKIGSILSNDNKVFVSGNSTFTVIDRNLNNVGKMPCPTGDAAEIFRFRNHSLNVIGIIPSENGDRLLSVGVDQTFRISDNKGKEIYKSSFVAPDISETDSVKVIFKLKDRSFFITQSNDEASLWSTNWNDVRFETKFNHSYITSTYSIGTDSMFSTVDVDGNVSVFNFNHDANAVELVKKVQWSEYRTSKGTDNQNWLFSVMADKNTGVIYYGAEDGGIYRWDWRHGNNPEILFMHTKPTTFYTMEPVGPYIFASSYDDRVFIIEKESGKLVKITQNAVEKIESISVDVIDNKTVVLLSGHDYSDADYGIKLFTLESILAEKTPTPVCSIRNFGAFSTNAGFIKQDPGRIFYQIGADVVQSKCKLTN